MDEELRSAYDSWKEEGRTEEQAHGAINFITSNHFKEWSDNVREYKSPGEYIEDRIKEHGIWLIKHGTFISSTYKVYNLPDLYDLSNQGFVVYEDFSAFIYNAMMEGYVSKYDESKDK